MLESSLPKNSEKFRISQQRKSSITFKFKKTCSTQPNLLIFNPQYLQDPTRFKRRQASLSIATSYDVLRDKLALDLFRKKVKETQVQAERNRAFLKNIGKRDAAPRDGQEVYYVDPKAEDKMAASQEFNQANAL